MSKFWIYCILILVSSNLKKMRNLELLCKNLELSKELQNVLYYISNYWSMITSDLDVIEMWNFMTRFSPLWASKKAKIC